MTFYKECFGGELSIQTIGDSAMGEQTPDEMKDRVMHSSLTNGAISLLASDMGEEVSQKGNMVSLCVLCSSQEELESFFNKLSQGANVGHAPKEEFWGAIYADLEDKFGIRWMLNYDKNQQ
jgi:PhnB protein